MRILIHGLNFTPELVGVGKYTGEMAEWLATRGNDVRVVTTPPFNPAWRVASGYSAWRYARESQLYAGGGSVDDSVQVRCKGSNRGYGSSAALTPEVAKETGVLLAEEEDGGDRMQRGSLTVFRCPVWVPRKPSASRRLLHLVSFAVSSFPIVLGQVRWRPHVVLVVAPTLFCAPAAWLNACWSGAKSWLHIQDFEVDAAFELGLLNSSRIGRLGLSLEKTCMSGFDRISTISEKMLIRLQRKVVESSRCVLFPNWVDTNLVFPLPRPNRMRTELRIPRDAVVALYSGNMAQKQGLQVLAAAADKLKLRKGLRFIFCGDGPGRAELASLTAQLENVQFLPLQPFDRLNDLLNVADIHLLPQRADAADLVMPSKLTGMLASGRPVIATAQRGTQLDLIVEGRGLVVPPDDAAALACAIDQLAGDPLLRERLGRSARTYAVSNLEKGKILHRFELELSRLALQRL